jgi:arylsulfatase A-like enzyme
MSCSRLIGRLLSNFLEVSGTNQPQQQVLDGVSLMPLLKVSRQLNRKAIFWHYPHYSNQGGLPAGAIREGDFKLIEHYEDGKVELYNVVNDLGEQHDLAASEPQRTAALKLRFREWLDSVGAGIPVANPNHDASKPRYSNPMKAPKPWRRQAGLYPSAGS